MTTPDPDPNDTPGLEPGGGVVPGDTPPAAASTSESVSHQAAKPARVLPVAALVAIAIIVVLVAGFFIAQAIDLL